MHPVFVIGVFAAGGLLWLLLSILYKPIGSIGKRLIGDAKKAMFEEEQKTNEEKREENKK
jgi:hypothetical protein